MRFFRRLSREDKSKLTPDPPKIKINWYTFLFPILVFLANLFLVLPLFGRPLPGASFSTPVLPMLSGGREEIVRFLILGVYILGPVSLYFYVLEITGRRLTSLLASLIYTLPTTRLFQAIVLGDEAHIFALSLLPLFLIYFLRFLRKPTVNLAIISGVSIALIALTSPFALFTFLIFVGILTYSEMLLGRGRVKLLYTFLVLIAAAGLSAFWYHPGFVIKIFAGEQGRALLTTFWSLVPPSFFLVPIFGAFSFLIFDRRPNLQPIFLAVSGFFVFLLLVFVGSHISTSFVPAPSRFLPELTLAAAFLLALILVGIVEILKTDLVGKKLKLSPKWLPSLARGFLIFILTFLSVSIVFVRPAFWALAEGQTQITGVKLVNNGGGIDKVFGGVITVLTSLALALTKLKTRIARWTS